MRALLALVVLSFAAPTVANACAMRMERPQVNLADLMDEVDEPAESVKVEAEKPEVVADAEAPAAEAPAVESAEPVAQPKAEPNS